MWQFAFKEATRFCDGRKIAQKSRSILYHSHFNKWPGRFVVLESFAQLTAYKYLESGRIMRWRSDNKSVGVSGEIKVDNLRQTSEVFGQLELQGAANAVISFMQRTLH
jgi:hypothetical protein